MFQDMTKQVAALDNKIKVHLSAPQSSTSIPVIISHTQSPETNQASQKRTHSDVDPSDSSAGSSNENIIKDQQVIHSTMNTMFNKLNQISPSEQIEGGDMSDEETEDIEFSEALTEVDESF